MAIVVWTLILAPILFGGAIPLGPVPGIFGGWFLYSGIKTCYKERACWDMVILNIVLYFVPGTVLLVLAYYAGNNGLLELLF